MRTLQIGNDWPGERVGGLNRYYFELLRHLPQTGTEVRGLVVGPKSIEEETKGAVQPFADRSDGLVKRCYRARQAAIHEIEQGGIDLIASHFALYTAPMGSWANRVPLVIHFHGPWAAESNVEGAASPALRMKLTFERSVYRKGVRFIVLSRSFQRELVTRYGVDEELTRIVPGGIDTDRFNISTSQSQARQQLGWPEGRPILLAVRRLVRRMGLENLIDAMRMVSNQCPEALLLLGGAGPLSQELQQRVRDQRLERNVRLLGRIEEADLPIAYRAADLTIVPSQSLEGFGMITLESLASGTPVLVTPVGGLPEVIEPFAPECVFADTSTLAMVSVLSEILEGRRHLPTEEACRAYALRQFAWPLIAQRVTSVYEEAVR